LSMWRSRKHGPHRGQHFLVRHRSRRKRGLFGPARHRDLEKAVHAESIADAERSAKELARKYNAAKTHDKKLRIKRATIQEANRLGVMANNPRISPEVRKNLREREEVFRRAAEKMSA
jgi:hypothetical protein